MKISAVIICLNEEKNIERCLKSLDFVDEIVVVDSGSTDKTVEIAKKYTEKVFFRAFDTYGRQKNYADNLAENDVVFSVDADEEVSDSLKKFIVNQLDNVMGDYSAVAVPRRTFYMGKFIKNSGWYPDYKTRIFSKSLCFWDEKNVHENLIVNGKIFRLSLGSDLLHYSYNCLSDHINRMNRYTELWAKDNGHLSKNKITIFLLFKPFLKFIKMYFLKRGFLEGHRGFTIAVAGSFYEFLKYVKVLEKKWEYKDD